MAVNTKATDTRWVWARWRVLCIATGADGGASRWWESELIERHEAAPRSYHTATHLGAVLDALDRLNATTQETEFATFFHDAVYDPAGTENEIRSAELARQALDELGAVVDIDTVVRYIEATANHSVDASTPSEERAGLEAFLDADMAILGEAPPVYNRYAAEIRTEYEFLPDIVYRDGRAAVLRGFLGRERIYFTEVGYAIWEDQARVNLHRELEQLAVS